MRKSLPLVIMFALLVSILSGAFGAKQVDAASTTITAGQDTDTQSDVAAGTNAVLNASQYNHIFAKFNFSGVTGSITQAKVRIYHVNHVNDHTLKVHHASTENWQEGGSKPTLGAQIASKQVTANGYQEFDVTNAVVNKKNNGQSTATFGFSTNLETWESYQSRQGANKPQLIVTTGSGSTMELATNFWFLASWSGESPFKANVDWANAYANGTDIWNPAFIGELAPYTTLRFMDWGGTNNSKVSVWSQRRLPTSPDNAEIGYIAHDDPLRAGLAYEWMIDLANRTNKNMWVNLPHLADDNYAKQLATLIKNKLKPSLKVYVEYSNETWNGGFNAFQYTIDQGIAQGLPGDNQWYKGGAFSLLKSVKIWKQFADVFGSEMSARVVRVAAFSGNYDIFDQGYNNVVKSSAWNPSGQKADLFAIAPYIGNDLDGNDPNIQTKFRAEIEKTYTERVLTAVAIADKYGVKLGTYEGGQHLLTNADKWSANQSIYDEYIYMLNKFAPHFVLFNHYANAGNWVTGGAWGAKAYTGQPLADAPKYRALKDWAANH